MPEPPKFKLLHTKIRSLDFKIIEGFDQEQIAFDFKIRTDHAYNYKNKEIAVMIEALIDEEKMPFNLHLEYEGLFEVNKRVGKERIRPFAEVNCPAILFPFVRECIADITRRAGFPPLYLSAINFVDLAKQDKSKGKKKSKEKK